MQNLINHIIEQEKYTWEMFQFAIEQSGRDSEPAIRWSSMWHAHSQLIKQFNLTAPTRNNLSTFKHKKYTIIKTCEL